MTRSDRKTLYVSDLDGTLLGSDAQVSDRTLRMLNKAIGSGVMFTIATARTPATVAPILKDLNLKLPAIVMTGTALWNKEDHKYTDIHYMSDRAAKELVEIYREQKCPTFLYTLQDELIRIYHIGPMSEIEKEFVEERRHTSFKHLYVPESGESKLPDDLSNTILFYGMQPEALADATWKRTQEVKDARTQKYHDFYGPEIGIIEAFSPHSTKAEAIKTLARRIGAERIVAFGDNLNDLPMLRLADTGIAMENGVEEVKRAADLVIGRNTEDSVARYILQDAGIEWNEEE